MLFSVAEEMNPERRSTMEDAHSIHGPGTWGAPNDGATFLGVYDGHGGRLIADYLEDHLAANVAQEWAHAEGEGRKEGAVDAEGKGGRSPERPKKRRMGDDNATDNSATGPKSEQQREGETMQIALERAFLLTDIQSRMDGLTTSGATVVCCVVVPKFTAEGRIEAIAVHAANAGDARAVLSSRTARPLLKSSASGDGKMATSASRSKLLPNPELPGESAVRITCDHKSTDEAEVKRIEAAGGMMMRGRVLGVLAVARSLGDHGLKEYVIGRPFLSSTVVRVEDDGSASNGNAVDGKSDNLGTEEGAQSTPTAPYTDGEFLIVACDGCWDVMEDQEAVDAVRKHVAANGAKSKENVAQFLVDESLRRGSTDNVTAIVYWL